MGGLSYASRWFMTFMCLLIGFLHFQHSTQVRRDIPQKVSQSYFAGSRTFLPNFIQSSTALQRSPDYHTTRSLVTTSRSQLQHVCIALSNWNSATYATFIHTLDATILFVSEQITNILRFFLSKNIRIARDRAWDQTVASRGKGSEFWQPYVEEFAVPPKIAGWRWEKWVGNSIVRMIITKGVLSNFHVILTTHSHGIYIRYTATSELLSVRWRCYRRILQICQHRSLPS